jgi:DNA-binding transcriptional regulator YhcF (GntR family)
LRLDCAPDPRFAAKSAIDRSLAVGTRLPTVRRLAADLGLAVNTVARSYRELEEAGLVETRGRNGTFVSAAGERSRERARRAAARYAATILRHKTDGNTDVRSLGLEPDEAIRIVDAALRAATSRRPFPAG